MSIRELNQELEASKQTATEVLELSNVKLSKRNLADMRSKLPSEYHDYLDVFDRAKANEMPPH